MFFFFFCLKSTYRYISSVQITKKNEILRLMWKTSKYNNETNIYFL